MRVYLHGFTGSPAMWDALGLAGMAEPILGHAPSLIRPAPFTDEVARLADRIAPHAPAHLVGYSLGARLALGICVAAPSLVARATLIGVNPGLADPDERAERIAADERWARLLEAEGIAAFAAVWEAQPLFAGQPEARRRQRLAQDPVGLAFALRGLGLGRMPDYWPALATLSPPVVYVAGERDEKFRDLAVRAAEVTRRGAARIIPGAGHDVVLEQPRALAALLVEDET